MGQVTDRLTSALAGRYTIQRELGRGGMATVFLAEERHPRREVAIKVLDPSIAAVLGPDRFLREVDLAAKLTHPHILPIHTAGEADGLLYYVMPYVEGESLRDLLNREKQLPVDGALQIAREVADALSYAHSRGVVHRDIKPENILLQSGHAVVADFGIARAISAAGGEQVTQTGIAIGTPAYMSPEQAAGSSDLDGRTDLYALGCVLYEMLAGQPPFTGSTIESVVRQHLANEPPTVTRMRPAVPTGVAAVVARSLAKTPADRFGSAALFAEALTHREPAASVATPAAATPPASPVRRLRALALAGAAVLVVAAGAWLALWFGDRQPAQRAYPRSALAVLPFQNLSADPADAYFAGGLHDELLTQLSKVAALSLRGRTSVMGYEATTKSIKQIAGELEVGTLVEGSVQVVGGRLRVNVQLIDAETDEHLWAESYNRTLDDAFAVQSDVAQRVVAAVGAALGSGERQAMIEIPTANAEAYRLYLQGRDYRRRGLRQNWEIAQQLFERALELDPEFALAYAALSELHGQMHWFRYDTSPARVAAQREAAEAALRLAPELPQAVMAMGLVHYWGSRDYQLALREFAIALEMLPNDVRVISLIGYVHRRLGNWDEAYAAFERAAELDPHDAGIFTDLGADTYRAMRRYPDAVRVFDRALALEPDMHRAAVNKGWTHVEWHGELHTLRAALDRIPRDADLGGSLGSAAAQRAELLLLERDAVGLLEHLQSVRPDTLEGQAFFFPTTLYAAWAHQLRGDGPAARLAFAAARVRLDAVTHDLQDDWRVRVARGLALAGLGRREEALAEARWLEQSVVYRGDAALGPVLARDRAWILARAGEPETTLDEIERLLARPSHVSVHTLRLDPRWDPIRERPRFKALLAEYAVRSR